MNTNDSLEKQLEQQLDALKFIKLWFKGMFSLTIVFWAFNIYLLTELNVSFLLTPTILFTGGTSLASMYMVIQTNKIKHNIKKISHKINIQEMNKLLNKKEQKKSNNINKSNINKKDYNYKPNNTYNNINLNTHTSKNYKVKRRVLKSSNIYSTKKSD